MPQPLCLQITDAAGHARHITLEPNAAPIEIGSAESCGLRFDSPAVEALHAELYRDGDHWCLRDCASYGGTFLDDNRLFISGIRLEIGQRVRLGTGDGAVRFTILAGAAEERDAVDVTAEVSGFVKAQKRERKRQMQRWAIALPSAGMVLIFGAWGIGGWVIARDQADRRAHPERYQNEENNAAVERLASIMAGEARPEDVDVKQIIAAASLGRTSKLADAAIALVKPGVALAESGPRATAPVYESPTKTEGPVVSAVDEQSLVALIRQQATSDAAHGSSLDSRVTAESRIVTLRRLRTMLDERQRLATLRATSTPADQRLADLERRLSSLGIDGSNVQWKPGDDLDSLERQLDPAVLEQIRLRLVQAMSAD